MDMLNDNLKNIEGLKYKGQLLLDGEVKIESLPATVEVDGYEVLIKGNGTTNTVIRIEEAQTETTKPYFPSSDFTQLEGTSLENGLVITDETNYWTWVEVPTNIYENTTYNGGTAPNGADDYDAIEKVLNNYAGTLVNREGYEDVWYDSELRTANNKEADLNDAGGCGLTYKEYSDLKKTMLSSIYQNGGFWIGQYEAGSNIIREDADAELTIPIVREGAYPYNFITCPDAQVQTSKMNSGSYTSSLMFGIQWDLTLKYLEEKNVAKEELTVDSFSWGNYSNSEFKVKEGSKCTEHSDWTLGEWGDVPNDYKNASDEYAGILLSTGASERNQKMNIYDLAGNVAEWTLEHYLSGIPCCSRGGVFYKKGTMPASNRGGDEPSGSNYMTSFRPTLF